MGFSIDQRRSMIEPATREMSIKHQCELLNLARSSFYYQPWEWNEAALEVMRVIEKPLRGILFTVNAGCLNISKSAVIQSGLNEPEH